MSGDIVFGERIGRDINQELFDLTGILAGRSDLKLDKFRLEHLATLQFWGLRAYSLHHRRWMQAGRARTVLVESASTSNVGRGDHWSVVADGGNVTGRSYQIERWLTRRQTSGAPLFEVVRRDGLFHIDGKQFEQLDNVPALVLFQDGRMFASL